MKTTEWKWYSGTSNEVYSATHDTREEAVAEAKAMGGGYICEACKPVIRIADFINFECAIEEADERCSEDYGNEDGDPIIELSTSQMQSLIDALRAAAEKWQDDNAVTFKPWVFHEVRNEERVDE